MARVAADIASLSDQSARDIVAGLTSRVLEYAAGAVQADDVTALAVRIGPPAGGCQCNGMSNTA
jgi:serine phosphatase RsbU (regulator of sigma subunit)